MTPHDTPDDQQTPEQRQVLAYSDAAIKELADADVIVITTPRYNYGMPAALKAWFDQVIRIRRTFSFNRSEKTWPLSPLMSGKRLVLLSSSGEFDFRPGGLRETWDHLEPHVRICAIQFGVAREDLHHVAIEYQEFGNERQDASVNQGLEATAALAPRLARSARPMTSRRKLPPLNALRAFEAAARHVSFKLAAEELCVTSTAISHQIRHLENLIGYKLFERTPRSIALTDAGRRLFPVLRDGFDRFSRAVADLNEDGHSVSVSVTPAFAARLLVPALVRLQQSHPDIRLSIEATERLADIGRCEVDVAVRYGPASAPPGMRVMQLYRDRYLPLASPRWASGRSTPLPALQDFKRHENHHRLRSGKGRRVAPDGKH